MILLTRRYRFPAAHVLCHDSFSEEENRRVFGKCANPGGHGHNYGLEITVTGELDSVPKEAYWDVVEHCYLCDMCYMTKCPYVPHEWNIDFPHLMLRAKVKRFNDGHAKRRDKILTATDTVGRLAGIPVVTQVVNAMNGSKLGRKLLKTTLGVADDAPLPRYHTKSARSRLADKVGRREVSAEPAGRTKGRVVIEMRPDLAPQHVERIKKLAREGFYDGIVFHRVIDGFMAQTGCPKGTGTGGSDYPDLPAEFNDEPHVRGVCSMARATPPNSANSQFFICFDDATFLDRNYTAWGKVIEGMENVEEICKASMTAQEEENGLGVPTDNITVVSVTIVQ